MLRQIVDLRGRVPGCRLVLAFGITPKIAPQAYDRGFLLTAGHACKPDALTIWLTALILESAQTHVCVDALKLSLILVLEVP
jgi:hypothetical protein